MFVLGVLVIVHEWGHYVVARAVGIRVEKFSIGFGPVIFGRKKGETEFAVSLLPLGGYVKMAGESPEEATGQEWEFQSKPLLQKFLVVFAGPFMNAFLAFVIFSAIFMIGQPTMTSKLGKIMPDTPASSAGLLEGDRIVAVDGEAVSTWEGVLGKIRQGKPQLTFTIERGAGKLDVPVTPRVQETKDIFGKTRKASFIGVSCANEMIYVKTGILQAIGMGFERVWTLTTMILASLGMMITGAMPFKDSMTGPIGIFFMTKEAAHMGAVYLFYFMGSLSVSLFVLNLLPIPVLDGGHVLFILIEKIKGSPLKTIVKERMTQAGLVALLSLMGYVILQDISRFSILQNLVNLFKH
jgi:regulator of sigma E protease